MKKLYFLRDLIPDFVWEGFRRKFLKELEKDPEKKAYLLDRVNFYNKLSEPFELPEEAVNTKTVDGIKDRRALRYYIRDIREILRFFKGDFLWVPAFGDVNWITKVPSLTKTRPTAGDNSNNVILKLDEGRHFNFIKDPYSWDEKIDKGIFMNDIGDYAKLNRVEFMQKHFGNPCCECGSIRNYPGLPDEWLKTPIKRKEMLKYRYILTLEGNDVATSLKWVMNSNSLAVMPEPTCESWFMESRLIPDFHYVRLEDDYSDLEDKINYYNSHPQAAAQIIKNAHEYVNQFRNRRQENLLQYLVALKYFELSGQVPQEKLSGLF